MLAELAAANAAFSIIKQTVQNGRELQDASGAILKYVGAREELSRRAKKKKKPGVQSSDLEEFMALEKLKQQETQLKEIMIWSGRPGLWQDWQRFQAQARKSRRVQEALAKKRREEFMRAFSIFVGIVVGVLGVVGLVVWVLFLRAL
jgi:preprotein translocase subunit Sss1|tara:strand:+ start:183 stop:623 length:441 start_codon:yes stop_codon:yes gene_type:complete